MTDARNALYKTKYGAWAGMPNGMRPDFKRCCEEVHESGRGGKFHQCGRPRGHGPDGAYCKQHDPDYVAAKRAEADAKYRAQRDRRHAEFAGPRFLSVLRQIAEGHNDPRTLAADAIQDFSKDTP